MKIVVAVRCYNETKNIERFMRGYDFADEIVVSDGGSTDGSVEMLKTYPKVKLIHFTEQETIGGQTWNPDAPHMNFVINAAKELDPDWLILDDMDDVPNFHLRDSARVLLEQCSKRQMNVFRLYMWGDHQHFPQMSRNYHPDYRGLWAWKPKEIDIHADPAFRHGTITGQDPDFCGLDIPYCLLHKSWHPYTIQAKIDRYNAINLPMNNPMDFAGALDELPVWAKEERP